MEIIIKNFKKGSQTRLKVSGNMTIAELKKKYADLNKDSESFQFKCNGQVLNDYKTLNEYEIEDEDIIIANSKSIGGGGF